MGFGGHTTAISSRDCNCRKFTGADVTQLHVAGASIIPTAFPSTPQVTVSQSGKNLVSRFYFTRQATFPRYVTVYKPSDVVGQQLRVTDSESTPAPDIYSSIVVASRRCT